MFGRMMNETMGKIHFYCTFIGVYAIFTPMHFLGISGNPRRYADFKEFEFMANLMPVHTFMTYAAAFTIGAQIIFVINLFWSMKKGAIAPVNPWEATTLEWTVSSPPPFDNFAGVHPVVHHGPYEYSVPGAPRDFVMQTDPPLVTGTVKH
jgi:cytochrome c oxidase subunit 1